MENGSHSYVDPLIGLRADEALPKLVERLGEKIFRLGLKLCGKRDVAEDLVQETFLLAFRKWEQFEGRSDLSSWLYTIAARVCQRRYRRQSGEPARLDSLDALPRLGDVSMVDAHSVDAHSIEGDPFSDRIRQEAVEVVDRALVELPLKFRLPLVLKEIADLSMREIAEVLGVKEQTVKTRVHRGRIALREALTTTLPQREEPASGHPHEVCLDLLRGKMEALDRGVIFPVPDREICSRCKPFFQSLDLTVEACRWIEGGALSESLRRKLHAICNHAVLVR